MKTLFNYPIHGHTTRTIRTIVRRAVGHRTGVVGLVVKSERSESKERI